MNTTPNEPKRILCVGLACLDIITVCKAYPIEDSEQRSPEIRLHRGGNAGNTSQVLGEIQEPTEYLGSLINSNQAFLDIILEQFKRLNVSYEHCMCYDKDSGFKLPISSVLINQQNGSRTIIVSFEKYPEIEIDHFIGKQLNFNMYKWIHFEGRNIENVIKMIKYVQEQIKLKQIQGLKISVEVEKKKTQIEEIAELADVVFIAKDYARSQGLNSKEEVIENIEKFIKFQPHAIIVNAWGEHGAIAKNIKTGEIANVKAYYIKPEDIKETVGCGDVFNACVISGLSRNFGLEQTLQFACRIAGEKAQIKNFFLRDFYLSVKKDFGIQEDI